MKTFQKNLLKRRKGNRRRDRFEIHATDIKDLCLRRFLLMYKEGVPYQSKMKSYPIRTYLTFRLGEKIEELTRECLDGYKPKPLVIKIKDIYLIGSPDIIVEHKGKRYIIECKSIKKEYYDALEQPLDDHVLQINFYLWLAERYRQFGYETKGYIVYVPKQESEPLIKIFPVRLSSHHKERFERILKDIKEFFRSGKLPKRVCVNEYSKFANECPVMRKCFHLSEEGK